MKGFFLIICLMATAVVSASDNIIVKSPVKNPGEVFGQYQPHIAYANLINESMNNCPHGYEKLREWMTRNDKENILHFEIKCLNNPVAHAKPSKP